MGAQTDIVLSLYNFRPHTVDVPCYRSHQQVIDGSASIWAVFFFLFSIFEF